MRSKKITTLFTSLLLSTAAFAGHVHTWHNVVSQEGTWEATLATINQKASFVTSDGSALTTFTINPGHSIKYGFSFDPQDDFDVAYTLTLTKKDTLNFVSKTCVFVVTAKGPANPDIHAINYNGANCASTVVHGVGEDFIVS